jgi:acyl-CoA synthetase (AMP-forming)/AMP-acid ligase II
MSGKEEVKVEVKKRPRLLDSAKKIKQILLPLLMLISRKQRSLMKLSMTKKRKKLSRKKKIYRTRTLPCPWSKMIKEASPLIRYRTHDITRLIPGKCPCGCPFPRHGRIRGRSDDMFIYRAVNIYPSQIDIVLSKVETVGSEYQIHLHHQENGRDLMTVKVERAQGVSPELDPDIVRQISDKIRRRLLVRPAVEVVDYHALPRTQKKNQRVFDKRNGNSK